MPPWLKPDISETGPEQSDQGQMDSQQLPSPTEVSSPSSSSLDIPIALFLPLAPRQQKEPSCEPLVASYVLQEQQDGDLESFSDPIGQEEVHTETSAKAETGLSG